MCPILGFYEFLRTPFLRKLLSWQSDSGCFKDNSSETDILSALKVRASMSNDDHAPTNYDKNQNYLRNAKKRLYETRVPGRNLLFELELPGMKFR